MTINPPPPYTPDRQAVLAAESRALRVLSEELVALSRDAIAAYDHAVRASQRAQRAP